jgi:hypothetical protein
MRGIGNIELTRTDICSVSEKECGGVLAGKVELDVE